MTLLPRTKVEVVGRGETTVKEAEPDVARAGEDESEDAGTE